MPCPSNSFDGLSIPGWFSRNWNGDVTFSSALYLEPAHSGGEEGPADGLQQLVRVVTNASSTNTPLMALGSGWAFVDNAQSDGWTVQLRNLTRRLHNVTDMALTPEWQQRQRADGDDYRPLVHVEAGIEIGALSEMLAAEGLAMRTLGGSNGQSLAGAIATSTHGGDWNEFPFPDYVRAIHLVKDGGQELWIERESDPITLDVPLRQALTCADTQIIRNDAAFNAAVVCCGRFGVVYSFVVEVRRAFRVVEVTTTPSVTQITAPDGTVTSDTTPNLIIKMLRDGMGDPNPYAKLFSFLQADGLPGGLTEGPDPEGIRPGLIGSTDPFYFEVLFNALNPNNLWVRRRWITPVAEDLPPKSNQVSGEIDGLGMFLIAQGLLAVAGGAALLVPIVGPIYAAAITATSIALNIHAHGRPMTQGAAVELILNALWRLPFAGDSIKEFAKIVLNGRFAVSMTSGRRGPHHLVTSGTRADSRSDEFRSDSIELVFDALDPRYLEFLNFALVLSPMFKQAGYITLRFQRASRGTLSMHNFPSGRAVSIECASMQGLPDNKSWLQTLEITAIAYGGRPHWGQYNSLSEAQVTALYGKNLLDWREALIQLNGVSTRFSNNFTRQRGLEPMNLRRQVTAVRSNRDHVITHLCGPAGASWSPIDVADAIQQINDGVAIYFTDVDGAVALIEVVDNRYLRTHPDSNPANNLDNLPSCDP